MNKSKQLHPDSEVIDALGGTTEVARLCKIKPPSVSGWKHTGIPQAREQFLRLLRPAAFQRREAANG